MIRINKEKLSDILQDGKDYIATALDGEKYKGTFVNKYVPGGIFFCCYPRYLSDGVTKNELVSFELA